MKTFIGISFKLQAIFLAAKFFGDFSGLFHMTIVETLIPLILCVSLIIALYIIFRHIAKTEPMAEDDFKEWLEDLEQTLKDIFGW